MFDVSLASSLLGIPFGTNVGGLTVYQCGATPRYVCFVVYIIIISFFGFIANENVILLVHFVLKEIYSLKICSPVFTFPMPDVCFCIFLYQNKI